MGVPVGWEGTARHRVTLPNRLPYEIALRSRVFSCLLFFSFFFALPLLSDQCCNIQQIQSMCSDQMAPGSLEASWAVLTLMSCQRVSEFQRTNDGGPETGPLSRAGRVPSRQTVSTLLLLAEAGWDGSGISSSSTGLDDFVPPHSLAALTSYNRPWTP